MNGIRFDRVSFSYGQNRVLEDVSFEILDRDFVLFTGPNGGGKSTAVKLICSLLSPDDGTIYFENPDSVIGYVSQRKPQFDYFFPMSVEEAVSLSFQKKSFDRPKKQNVLDSLKVVGLEGFRGRFVDELSGGQKQRVFIARALAMMPDILILDEPTSGVDSISGESLLGYIEEFMRLKNLTVIYVTHDISEVCSLATKRFEFANKRVTKKNIDEVDIHV